MPHSFSGLYDLSMLHHIVLDEADSLLDDSFNELTLRLLRKMRVSCKKIAVSINYYSIDNLKHERKINASYRWIRLGSSLDYCQTLTVDITLDVEC